MEKAKEGKEMGKKGVPHRKWSKEEKLKIVKEHLEQHESICELSRQYEIRDGTITNWVRVYMEHGEEGLEPKPHSGNPYAALYTNKNLSEVERLRLLVAKQEVEIARLKKGYYVEGVGADKVFVTGKDSNTK